MRIFTEEEVEILLNNRICEKPKTNADGIRSFSAEELAEFLEKIVSGNRDEIGINCGNYKCEEWKCTECISKWLQSEVE